MSGGESGNDLDEYSADNNESDELDDEANESGYDPIRMKQKYSDLYDAELEGAVHERDEIIKWILNADSFSEVYKSSINRWLEGLDLGHPDVPKLLDDAAEQLNRPGLATQVGTLRMMLGSLSSRCRTLQMYRSMSK